MRVLVVVDVQNDFISGSLGSITAQSIIPHMKSRIKDYADAGDTLILFTKDTHDENYDKTLEGIHLPIPHCVRDTKGWSIVKEISSLADGYSNFLLYSDEEVIHSRSLKDTFGSVKLAEILKKYEEDITDNIVYSVAKIDGKIVENFIQ